MTSNNIRFYSKISVLFGHHHRGFLGSIWEQMQRLTARHYSGRESKWEISIKSLPSELWESWGRGGRKIVRAIGDGEHQGYNCSCNLNWLSMALYELTETEETSTCLHQVLCVNIIALSLVFLRLLTVRMTLVSALGTLSSLLGCHVKLWCYSF